MLVRRGRGRRAERDIDDDDDLDFEEVGEWEEGEGGRTGVLRETDVEGLMSWVGDGWRFREADWRVEVSVAAGLEAMVDR